MEENNKIEESLSDIRRYLNEIRNTKDCNVSIDSNDLEDLKASQE